MAVPALNYSQATQYGALVANAARALRDARQHILNVYAAIDQLRDAGAVGAYFATKVGAPDATEAGRLFDELASLKGYVESEAANTFGAAVLQACAKLGV